jgi:NodT family efflux transporter outer membrane factor (OMF) lipoprotein
MRALKSSLALSLAAALTVAGCASSRTSAVPGMTGATGPFVSGANAAFAPAQPDGAWWRLYADPALDALIADALENNRQLAEADANLDRVRAALNEARVGYLPSTTLSAGYTEGKVAAGDVPAGADRDFKGYNAGLSLGYEVDLFGRVRNAVRAARADRDAQAAAVDLVRLTVASETARAYADACAANAQIAVAERTIGLQQRSADLTKTLFDAGRANGLDTARADSQLQNTRAALSPLRAQRDGALFRLAVLTGKPPAQASDAARGCAKVPQLQQAIPVGDGAGLLARRPDVRQAKRQLDAATARTGVARAAIFPTVSLGASASSIAAKVGGLNDDAGFSFSVGPLISWSFPNLLGNAARVGQAEAGADAALARFDHTMLAALRDTETALTTYANELDRRAALLIARDRAADAQRLSQLRFDQGADSFLSLLDAQRTLASAEAALAQSDALVTTGQIAVFQALGGGWEAN